ncbi:hypothetical protein EWM64_g6996 [Hericium alpestre]|uniref:Uncharacterized protein n=1 Tax=Hericium alpestre TaxID=135208 RepID=A0A4Y9ZR05_9AGAM|nr:hypothetical protein EWM64_g6996 [Hericium alpestre]
MSLDADIWGYITGVLSVLAVIFQIMRINLPSTKLKKFDTLLQETEDLLHEADEEGLLSGGDFVHQTNETLIGLRTTAQPLRSRVHMAKTIFQECLGVFTGLSVRISLLCSEVKELKADIATTSEKARETLRQLGLINNQQEAQRIALGLLCDGEVSGVGDSGDASLSEEPGNSDSFDESRSQSDETESNMLNEVGIEVPTDVEDKTLTYDRDIIHEAIEIVEETCNTTVACEAA